MHKKSNITNCTYYSFDDVKHFDPNQFKIDKMLYKNIIIYYIE